MCITVRIFTESALFPQHCLDLGNISSMMAIVVAGLGSSPIRRLATTWEMVPKSDMELFKHMDSILEERVGWSAGTTLHLFA